MSKKVVPPAIEFSIFGVASAMLTLANTKLTPAAVVDLLIDEAIDEAIDEEDAGKYALLAAQLIDAYELNVITPVVRS